MLLQTLVLLNFQLTKRFGKNLLELKSCYEYFIEIITKKISFSEVVSKDEALQALEAQQLSNQNYEVIQKILNNGYNDEPQ